MLFRSTDGCGLVSFFNKIIQENINFDVFEIYNLAAMSHVAISFEIPEYTLDVDAKGVLKILEYINSLETNIKNKIRFYQAGTSELYGKVLEIPQNENTPFNPVSPYAAAKLYGYNITKIYREGYGIYAVNGILFNHESSRRTENFVTMKIINSIKNIINNKIQYISVGNLDSKRDWGHAKDYVYGMWLMLQQDKPEDYVLATGKTQTVREFIEKSFQYKGFTIKWEGNGLNEIGRDQNNIIRIVVDEKYFRPCEVDLLLGDATKAKQKLGWEPKYDTIEKIIIEMF